MVTINNNNQADIIENWDHTIQPHHDDSMYKLLEVISSENNRLDIELDELYDNRFLSTATGNELEKIGDLVGVIRKNNESDVKLRKRIRGAFAAFASDTTYNSFTAAAISILDGSADSVAFITPPDSDPKTVTIEVDGAVVDANPLTVSEIVVLLNGALSVDAQLNINQVGTFAFDSNDESLEGWNDGTWSAEIN